MEKKIKIALVGCGNWGMNILRDLLSLEADVSVIDSDIKLEKKVISLGATSFFKDLSKTEQFDGIIISTPASTHRILLEKLKNCGKPIFVEKPLCTSGEDLEWIKKNCDGMQIFLMHVWRYHAGIVELGTIAKEKKLGNPVQLVTKRTNWTSPRQDVDSVWTLLPHDLTIAKEILGYIPEPRNAVCEVYNGTPRGMSGALGEVPGMIFEVSNRYFDKRREVRLHCENGVAVLKDEITDHIDIYLGGPESKMDSVKPDKIYFQNIPPLKTEIDVFLEFIKAVDKPKSDLVEGIEVVEKIIKLRELAGIK